MLGLLQQFGFINKMEICGVIKIIDSPLHKRGSFIHSASHLFIDIGFKWYVHTRVLDVQNGSYIILHAKNLYASACANTTVVQKYYKSSICHLAAQSA